METRTTPSRRILSFIVLLALTSDTQLVVFKPSKDGYEEVAKYKVADSPTWAYPIVDGKRVFVKDRDSLALWTIE